MNKKRNGIITDVRIDATFALLSVHLNFYAQFIPAEGGAFRSSETHYKFFLHYLLHNIT